VLAVQLYIFGKGHIQTEETRIRIMFTTACFPLSPTAVVAEMPEAEHEGIGGDCLTCGTSQEVRKAQHLEGGSTGL
jgi:hypothetical protein